MTMRAVIFGAGGGIGRALVGALANHGSWAEIHAGSRRPAACADGPVRPFAFDLESEASIAAALAAIGGPLDLVVVATGVLQDKPRGISPERSIRALDAGAMAHVLAINTVGPAIVAKHALPLLHRDRRAVFAALSARVGSISDNRLGGWHSYRASKAALNMLIANFAIELGRTHPLAIVAGLHPGTVDTALCAPFQRGLRPGQLTSADDSAARLLAVIEGLTPSESGHCLAWDGTRIPA